jgi:hypothetical protein
MGGWKAERQGAGRQRGQEAGKLESWKAKGKRIKDRGKRREDKGKRIEEKG